MPNHPITPLASAQINHDTVSIELLEPDAMPAMVRVAWPLHPTVIDPKNFGDTASVIVRMFSTAHVELARIKARRHL